ncbi:flagellar filament capping protein FliD [Sulfurospirillum diekertiae]|uniref:flagellar filament capping protein FliD n=2 Tax=Sulfurospirillum diekertiae TaxID=1854492 RepID=UPI00142775A4|nr:flagellar filament capping protein FliD [Sulfurospirillum diekertiae]QIR79725.1 flagellar filament capping protein FliD [Sulfurospirillum diekertiae]
MATTSTTTTTSSTTGSLSSLGLGSGVLTSDVLDKLRAADESGLVTPIDNKLTANATKQTDLASILSLANALKSSTNVLSDENNYLKRTTTVSNDAVSVTAIGGAAIENFTLHVNTLAKQDIYQSTSFSSQTSSFTSASDTLNLKIGTSNYTLDITSTTTLSDLKDMINDRAGGKVTASILNVGGTNPYKLVIKSTSTGANNAITLSSIGTGTALTDLGLNTVANHLQTATDASFVYNGVTINRSSNTVSDLVSGLSLTLNKEQTDATTNTTVAITQDWTNITTNLKSLVSGYNDLMTKLKSATTYDTTAKTAGTFQGVSQVNSLSSAIRKEVLSVDSKGRGLSDYGLSMDSKGVLSFNSATFDAKVAANPADIKDYFQGSTTYSSTSYNGSAVAAGALSIGSSAFSINGKAITLTTGASSTTADNLAAIKTAINNAGLSGITASIGTNNNIVLKGTAGADIVIKGDTTALASLGLAANNVYSSPTIKDGIFSTFNSIMNGYVNTTDGTLTQYNTSLTTLKTALTTSRATAVSRLDTKYNAMATKFAAYDSMISKLNNEFSSLSTIIKQSMTSKS